GEANVDRPAVGMPAMPQRRVGHAFLVSWTKAGCTLRRADRELVISAETEIVEVVVRLDDDALVGKLRLKMQRVSRAADVLGSTEERAPVGAIGMDGPDTPQVMAAQALRLQRAEHNPAVLEDDGVQGAPQVQVADAVHIAAILVHDVELEGKGVG